MAFDLGEEDDFCIRYKNFKQILISLRKTIFITTRSPQLNKCKHSAVSY